MLRMRSRSRDRDDIKIPSDRSAVDWMGGQPNNRIHPMMRMLHQTPQQQQLGGVFNNQQQQQGWTRLMTFRTFVAEQLGEDVDGQSAIEAYDAYVESFKAQYALKLFFQLRTSVGFLNERYSIELLHQEFERSALKTVEQINWIINLSTKTGFPTQLSLTYTGAHNTDKVNCGFTHYHDDEKEEGTPFLQLQSPYYLTNDPSRYCLCLKNVPANVTKWDILTHLTQNNNANENLIDIYATGEESISQSSALGVRKVFLCYRDATSRNKAEQAIDGTRLQVSSYTCRPIVTVTIPQNYNYTLVPAAFSDPSRMEFDLKLSARLIIYFDKLFGIVFEDEKAKVDTSSRLDHDGALNLITNEEEFKMACQAHPLIRDASEKTVQERLDLNIWYLRNVHCIAYYQGKKFSSSKELFDIIGCAQLRRPDSSLSSTCPTINDETFIESLRRPYELDADIETPPPYQVVYNYKMKYNTVGKRDQPPPEVVGETSSSSDIIKKDPDAMDDGPEEEQTERTTEELSEQEDPLKYVTERLIYLFREVPIQSLPDWQTLPEVQSRFETTVARDIEQLEEEKWKCLICSKMFKGAVYVKKHIWNKHPDVTENVKQSCERNWMVQRFFNDPYAPNVVLPKPTPNWHNRADEQQHNNHRRHNNRGRNLRNSMPGGYRDLDAPRRSVDEPGSGGNIRAAVAYDDL